MLCGLCDTDRFVNVEESVEVSIASVKMWWFSRLNLKCLHASTVVQGLNLSFVELLQ